MKLELTDKEFRRLLDLVYIGNWVLNSTREQDPFEDYDRLESKLFGYCREQDMGTLVEKRQGIDRPSRAYADGGIHEAIADYEDAVFYEILAEDLARRDMEYAPISQQNYEELIQRMDAYMEEFEHNGTARLQLET